MKYYKEKNWCHTPIECEVKIDARCVAYNFHDKYAPNYLTYLKLQNGTSLHQFMETADREFARIDSLVRGLEQNYSTKISNMQTAVNDMNQRLNSVTGQNHSNYII